jgi:predicted secreted Zn-dependent protease
MLKYHNKILLKIFKIKIKNKLFFLVALSFLLTLISISITEAKPAVNTNINYYTVTGKTIDEIANSLNTQTPIIYQGKKYHANTAWNVKWRFYWQESNNSCQITSVNTSVDVKFTMPKLVTYSSLNTAVKNKWDKYYSALINHENGHKNFGIQAANKIEKAILEMGKKNTCSELEKTANNIGYQIIKEDALQEKKYDEITNHGAKDGAIFP